MKNLLSIRHSILRNILLLLAFTAVCNNAWGEDVFYEKCNDVSDITNGGTYIIVISNGTKYYAVQQDSKNYVAITPQSNGTIKNPSSSIVWTAGSTTKENGYSFVCNSKYIYCSGSNTTLKTNGSDKSTWIITKLSIGTNTFKMNLDALDGRYIGWNGSMFAAYVDNNFVNQFEQGKDFGQYSGALYIYKIKTTSSKTLSSITVSGTPTRTTYTEGDALNPAGLVVTGTYSDSSEETITEGITWAFNPKTLSNGNTSCVVTATVDGIKSEEYTVTGLTVTEDNDYYAVVSTYGGDYYAMNYTINNSSALKATSVYVVNGKVVNAEKSTLAWKLDDNGYIVNREGKYISYSDADVSLKETTDKKFTKTNDEGKGLYWLSDKRTFIYRDDAKGFKTYIETNAGTGDYGTKGYLMDFADGYVRTGLTDGKMGTICMPCAVNANDFSGAKFYSIAGMRGTKDAPVSIVLIEEEGSLVAGRPYIIEANATALIAAYTGVAVEKAGDYHGLKGTFEKITNPEYGSVYVISNAQIKKLSATGSIGANKAYIDINDVPTFEDSSATSGAKLVEFSFEDSSMNINGIEANGNDQQVYTISGIRVDGSNLKKGIYIINGRKVVR